MQYFSPSDGLYLYNIYPKYIFLGNLLQSRDSEGLDNICSVFYSAH